MPSKHEEKKKKKTGNVYSWKATVLVTSLILTYEDLILKNIMCIYV